MVKIEEDPHRKEQRYVNENIDKINIAISDLWPISFECTSRTGRDFEGRLTEIVKKTETGIFRKTEVIHTKQIATVFFNGETNSLYLSGNVNQLREIAEKLEDAGYNVTIWV